MFRTLILCQRGLKEKRKGMSRKEAEPLGLQKKEEGEKYIETLTYNISS